MVFAGGAGFNLLLIRFLAARPGRRSWVRAIVCGVVTHVGAVLAADSLVGWVFAVPDANREEVMYFVGPAVTLFISVPVGVWAYHRPFWGGVSGRRLLGLYMFFANIIDKYMNTL